MMVKNQKFQQPKTFSRYSKKKKKYWKRAEIIDQNSFHFTNDLKTLTPETSNQNYISGAIYQMSRLHYEWFITCKQSQKTLQIIAYHNNWSNSENRP